MTARDAASELRWYFRFSDGAMGLRSNFGAMVAQLEGGGFSPRQSYEMDEHALQAARKVREARQALEQLGWERVVLAIAFRAPGGEERLLAALSAAAAEHRRSRSKREIGDWLERARTSKDIRRKKLWAGLRAKAQALLSEALEAYVRAAGPQEA